MIFAFTTVSAVIGSSTARGLTSLFLGLLFGVVGIDSQTGRSRFAFGVPELLDGIDVVVLAVGLFAVGEALYVARLLQPARRKNRTDQRLFLDVERRLEAFLARLAARHGDRLPFRIDSGGRRRDSDVLCPTRWKKN